jgi:hypothetical protein
MQTVAHDPKEGVNETYQHHMVKAPRQCEARNLETTGSLLADKPLIPPTSPKNHLPSYQLPTTFTKHWKNCIDNIA